MFDISMLDSTKLNDFAICRRQEGIGIRVQRSNARLDGAVEELGQVTEVVQVMFINIIEVDSKKPDVELETRNKKVVRNLKDVER